MRLTNEALAILSHSITTLLIDFVARKRVF